MDEDVRNVAVASVVPRKQSALDFEVLQETKPALPERIGHARRESQTPETEIDVYWPGAGKPTWKSRFQGDRRQGGAHPTAQEEWNATVEASGNGNDRLPYLDEMYHRFHSWRNDRWLEDRSLQCRYD